MQDLKISFVQLETVWHDIQGNLNRLDELLQKVPSESQLLIFPETFTTGFTMEPEKWSEKMDGKAVTWMLRKAKELSMVLGGSLIIEDEGQYYNRFVFTHPDGSTQHYNKRHLFSLAGEDNEYSAGNQNITVNVGGWKIRPQICYDLRFPVWSKNTDGYDLLLYSANWPAKRIEHWRKLAMARAIENQCYVLAVNRYGKDGNGLEYTGNSMLVSPMGEVLSEPVGSEQVVNVVLNYKAVQSFREFLSVLDDGDSFDIH